MSRQPALCVTVRSCIKAIKHSLQLAPLDSSYFLFVVIFAVIFVVIVAVFVLVPPGPVTVNCAVNEPVFVYVCLGFCDVLFVPSPKFHE
jgi:hypothetical protein